MEHNFLNKRDHAEAKCKQSQSCKNNKDIHTIYPGNNMCQKCGRKSGLWVLHEIVNKTYAENMKKTVDAVCELPAK